jgi:hypothetical protein
VEKVQPELKFSVPKNSVVGKLDSAQLKVAGLTGEPSVRVKRGLISGRGSKRTEGAARAGGFEPGGGKMVNSVDAEAGVAALPSGLTNPAVDRL